MNQKPHDKEELNRIFDEADQCDKEIFAEERSNLLLVAGEHYMKRQNELWRRIRDSKQLSDEQKLRLTKNHIQKIVKIYVNNIISTAPGVGFEPKNPNELQDQKAAELHHAIWKDADEKYHIETELIDMWADDYIAIGEVAVKIFWDPNKGKIKAYNQKLDEEGNPVFLGPQGEETAEPQSSNMFGQMISHALAPDENDPVYEGGFVIDTIQGMNLLRDPNAKSMTESEVMIYRKMVDIDYLKKNFAQDDEDLEKMFQSSMDETIVVFDSNKSGYYKPKNQAMVREFYFRPCPRYPRGYFFFTVKEGIFAEGELPGGIFPIVYRHCERIPTSPRGRSPIKTMRPYQAEINRSASKIAEHQITLGDDKLVVTNGTKVSAGVSLPGVRTISVTGMNPVVMEGRSGAQYLDYMTSQIEELYQVMNVMDDADLPAQLDPYTMLFRAASQKKAFQRYIRGFERFLIDFATTYLALAKIHLPEDAIVYAVGKSEQVNISEFKNSQDICYEITVKAQSNDIETKLGQQLAMNHILQYTGQKLDKEDIGKLIAQMPYVNTKDGFSDLTLDFEQANNIILALDRGKTPVVHDYDNHTYIVRRLVARKQQADFDYLPPQIQQAYEMLIGAHEQAQSIQIQQIQRAEQGFIPTGGYMAVCDIYVPDPGNPEKTQRARVPYDSLAWLIKQLELQGQTLEQLNNMNQGALADMSRMISQGGGVVQTAQQPMSLPPRGGQPGQAPALTNPGRPAPGGSYGRAGNINPGAGNINPGSSPIFGH